MSYTALKNVVRDYAKELMSKANVNGIGIGYKEKDGKIIDGDYLVVLVKKKLSLAEIEAKDLIPKEYQGFKTDVVEVGDIEAILPTTAQGYNGNLPAKGGASIGLNKISAGTGTLGCKVRAGGLECILTNSHVAGPVAGAKKGDEVVYPSEADKLIGNHVVGEYLKAPTIYFDGSPTWYNQLIDFFKGLFGMPVTKYGGPNKVDAALIKIRKSSDVSDEIDVIGDLQGINDNPAYQEQMQKTGRTTGHTT
jgi:hypothetical protein